MEGATSQTFGGYNCCQTGAPRAAVTSSIEDVAAVESICKCSLARAARATAISPSGWNAFWLLTGLITIGLLHLVPKSRTDMSMFSTSTTLPERIGSRD